MKACPAGFVRYGCGQPPEGNTIDNPQRSYRSIYFYNFGRLLSIAGSKTYCEAEDDTFLHFS